MLFFLLCTSPALFFPSLSLSLISFSGTLNRKPSLKQQEICQSPALMTLFGQWIPNKCEIYWHTKAGLREFCDNYATSSQQHSLLQKNTSAMNKRH